MTINMSTKFRMSLRRMVAVGLVSVALAACEGAQQRPGETIGTLLGAGLGALVGSQIGAGKGNTVAVAVGVLAGAYLGGKAGKSLDEADRNAVEEMTQDSLENNPSGVPSTWDNPDKDVSAKVTPTETYVADSGVDCRDFEQTVMIEGKADTVNGTACRNGDGRWELVE